jgi:GMP synthase-like glutamine amidotransferase
MLVKIISHVAHEGPGYLAEFLDRKRIAYELICIEDGAELPDTLDDTSGIVFMGGPMSVNDPFPWIARETALIRRAVDADVPVLGHCLGGQLMAKALGAKVTRNSVSEIGWLPVEVVPSALARSWVGELPDSFPVYHWHGETFELPEGATHLLRSQGCANQAFVRGKHLALQCHVEMTPQMIRDWIGRGGELRPSPTVQSGPEMLRDVERRIAALRRVADVLYERWTAGLVA